MRKLQLDGLRFILFLFVFATHYSVDPVRVGYFGYALPVFFVMSGFLITNVLLSADSPSLSGKLKVFYSRRILRICPAYFLVVAIMIGMGLLTYPFYYLTYLINLKLFAISLDQQSSEFLQWFVQGWRKESLHFWSLSVEEQFYIVYPLALYLTPIRYRTLMFFTVLVVSIAARFAFMAAFPQGFYGTLLPVCTEYFVWGCLFAWWETQDKLRRLSPAWVFNISLLLIVSLIAVEFYRGENGFLQFRTSHYQTPIAIIMGFFIWGLWSLGEQHIAARFLSWKPFVYFGEMSYTLYLVHLVAFEILMRYGGNFDLLLSSRIVQIAASFVLTLVMAMAIWHLFEKPVYALRRYLPYHR